MAAGIVAALVLPLAVAVCLGKGETGSPPRAASLAGPARVGVGVPTPRPNEVKS